MHNRLWLEKELITSLEDMAMSFFFFLLARSFLFFSPLISAFRCVRGHDLQSADDKSVCPFPDFFFFFIYVMMCLFCLKEVKENVYGLKDLIRFSSWNYKLQCWTQCEISGLLHKKDGPQSGRYSFILQQQVLLWLSSEKWCGGPAVSLRIFSSRLVSAPLPGKDCKKHLPRLALIIN